MKVDQQLVEEPHLIFDFRTWSTFVGFFLIAWESTLISLTSVNFFEHEDSFVSSVDWMVVAIVRIPTIIAGTVLLLGVAKKSSTFIAVGMWTALESQLLYFLLFLRNYEVFSLSNLECYGTWIMLCVKVGLLLMVNCYHNYIKRLEKGEKIEQHIKWSFCTNLI